MVQETTKKQHKQQTSLNGYLPFTEHLDGVAQIPSYRGTEASEGAYKRKSRQRARGRRVSEVGLGTLHWLWSKVEVTMDPCNL